MIVNESDRELVRLFKEGKNRKEIAEETGREYSSLCRRMRKLGLGVSANTEQKRRCTGCRKLIPDNSYKFCPYCGADIQTEEDKVIKSLAETSPCTVCRVGERDSCSCPVWEDWFSRKWNEVCERIKNI